MATQCAEETGAHGVVNCAKVENPVTASTAAKVTVIDGTSFDRRRVLRSRTVTKNTAISA